MRCSLSSRSLPLLPPWPRLLGVFAGLIVLLGAAPEATALKISAPIPLGYELGAFRLTPNGQTAVYELMKDGSFDVVGLTAVPVAGGAADALVDLPLTSSQRSVDNWEITPDGGGIVFLSDKDAQQFRTDLFYVPIDGSAVPLKLNVAPATNDLDTFRFTSDGSRVVFEAASRVIYSVPTTGGAVATLGTGTGSFLPRYRIAPDGTRVVFTFDADGTMGPGETQIYSVPVTGGMATQLSNQSQIFLPGTNGGLAAPHAITPDSMTVLFFAANGQELWITPIDQMSPVKLAGPLAIYGPDFRLTPDGTTAVFTAGSFPAYRIYRVPLDGSTTEQPVSGVGQNVIVSEYQMSPNGQIFVYRVFGGGKYRLFRVSLAGGDDTAITPAMPGGLGPYNGYRFDPTGLRVVYLAEQITTNVLELFSVPIGGGTPVALSKNPMPSTGDVFLGSVQVSSDAITVIYSADQDTDTVNELFSAGLASGGPIKLHPNLAPDKDVAADPLLTPDGQKVVYVADQETNDLFELFVSDDPAPGPTPTSGAAVTPTAGDGATATPTPLATRTPAPEAPDRCADCIDNDFDGVIDRVDADCPPLADGGGVGLAGDAAKAAIKCQKALGKLGTDFAVKRTQALGTCLQKAFACVQAGGDAACFAKAGAGCGKAEAARQNALAKLVAGVAKSCGDPPVAAMDLGGASGLGHAAEASGCADFGTPNAAVAGVAACIAARHACRAEELVGIQIPRARLLFGLTGRDAALEAPCLPPGGPDGAAADAKAVIKCQKALAKAGLTYAAARLKAEQKCADGVFACLQGKPTDPTCRIKADATCAKLDAKIAAARTKVGAAIAKGCGGTLALADVFATDGVGFALRTGECTALANTPDSLAAVAGCVVAQHTCRVDQMLVGQAPRAGELGALAP
jgi:Tol biopolymer transport system component